MRALLVAGTVGIAACGTCQPDRSPPPGASASASASSPPAATPAVPSHTAHSPPTPKLACRIVALEGEARVESPGADAGTTPLLLQGVVQPETWVDLPKGSRVVARDPRTTRETTFRGPGRARICVGFAEESWLVTGTFSSSVGSGETPGAEEWVITPSAVVRYTAAQLSLEAKAHETIVMVDSGVAFAWYGTAGDAGTLEEGWLRLPVGKTHLAGTRDDTPAAAVDRCKNLSDGARELARQVMTPGGGADGGVIAQQVTLRREARAACAIATLRVDALAPADAAPLLRTVTDANAAWNGLPGERVP